MEKIDAKLLGMVSVTLLTRLTAHLERTGVLPLGWTAGELRAAATAADNNILHGSDPELHHSFAKALRRIAEVSIQPVQDSAENEGPAVPAAPARSALGTRPAAGRKQPKSRALRC